MFNMGRLNATVLRIMIVGYIIIEVCMLVVVIRLLGFFGAIFLFLITTAFGFRLLQTFGWQNMRQYPSANLLMTQKKSLKTLFVGFLLIIPGFFTDLLAVVLWVLPLRPLLNLMLKSYLKTDQAEEKPKNPDAEAANVIEGEYWRDE